MECPDTCRWNSTVLQDALFHLLFNRMQNVSEVFSPKEDGFSARVQANELSVATIPVNETEEVAAHAWERTAAIDDVLHYVTYW